MKKERFAMAKHIQAYFETENEAEHIRVLLQTYNTEDLEVGKLADGHLGGRNIIVPIAAVGGSTGAGIGLNGSGGGVAPLAAVSAADDELWDGDNNLHYVLSAKVLEEDYEEIRNLIRHNRGHVERVD
jgi:hypothetical protein